MQIDENFIETLRLPDGREVELRAVRPSDKQLFVDALERSSPQTVYGRFLTSRVGFSQRELSYLTELDGLDHFALGAVHVGVGVGVARFVREESGGSLAEVAFAVDDAFRRVGLGEALLGRLFQAAAERGILQVRCVALAENVGALSLLRKFGELRLSIHQGIATYELSLQG